jgi:hypothetical protein
MAAPAREPALRLVAASPTVTVYRYPRSPELWFDLGTHVIAGQKPFEVRTTRKSYHDPIVATQITRVGGVRRVKTLPAGLVKDFAGLTDFLHLKLTDSTGKVVAERDQSFCPNEGQAARIRPDAPDRSPYPYDCSRHPFALGSVMGIQAGWGVNATFGEVPGTEIPDGTYTASVNVNKAYRIALGIPASQARASVSVTIRTVDEGDPNGRSITKSAITAAKRAGAPT